MIRTARLLAAIAVILTACGGGGDADPTLATPGSDGGEPTTTRAVTPTTAHQESAATTAAPEDGVTTVAPSSTMASGADLELRLELVADGFGQPVFLTSPPARPTSIRRRPTRSDLGHRRG